MSADDARAIIVLLNDIRVLLLGFFVFISLLIGWNWRRLILDAAKTESQRDDNQ